MSDSRTPNRQGPDSRLHNRLFMSAHESGHCLFAWLYPHAKVKMVRYSVNRGFGLTEANWEFVAKPGTERVFAAAAMSLAGIAAEIILLDRFYAKNSEPDLILAHRLSGLVRQDSTWPSLVRRVRHRYPGPDRLALGTVFRNPPCLALRHLLLAEYRWARGLLVEHELDLRRLTSELFEQKILGVNELTALLGPQR